MADAATTPEMEDIISIKLTHGGSQHTFNFPKDSTITDLSDAVESDLSIPMLHQKFLIPKLGLLKPPFEDPALSLVELENKKISLIGTPASEVISLLDASRSASTRDQARAAQRRERPHLYPRRPVATADSTYTFLSIRPLPNLPDPERSRAFLERLAADPGIATAMKAHRFTVGLLTEMDPLSYTEASHEGTTRILGLNRNRGEVIELRLRTDAYDGYRDYRTIRNTLCHELAHNVHGPHDRRFWDLCHQIEREVGRADWRSGGRSVGGVEYYEPPAESEEIAYDHGGWTGGEFVLGGGGGGSSSNGASTAVSRREVIALAAEERQKKMREQERKEDEPGEGSL